MDFSFLRSLILAADIIDSFGFNGSLVIQQNTEEQINDTPQQKLCSLMVSSG